jgi:hypothetical protein
MKTTAEILAESRSIRFSFKKPDAVAETLIELVFSALPWQYKYFQILAPNDFSWTTPLVEIYGIAAGPVGNFVPPEGVLTIIHGHSADGFCQAKTLCHVYGYKPDGLSALQEKNWRKLYDS